MAERRTAIHRAAIWSAVALVSAVALAAAGWWWAVERSLRPIRQAQEASNWQRTFRLATDYLKTHRGRDEVRLAAARSASHLGMWDHAEKYFAQVPDLRVEDLRLRAGASIALEQWSLAGDLLEQIIALAPDDAEAMLKLAAIRYKDGHDVEATEFAERAVQILADTPAAAAAYGQLGAVHSARGNRTTAIDCFRKALELDPEGKSGAYSAPVLRLDLANNLILTGSPAEAQIELEHVLAAAPKDRARVLYEIGRARLAQGDSDGAEQYWQQALLDNPRHVATLVALGEQALVRKQPDTALEHIEAAIQFEPRNSAAHYALARAYAQTGRTEEGRRAYDLARSLREESERTISENRGLLNRPNSPETKVMLATREAARGNWQQAERWAREAVELAPHDRRLRYFLEQVQARRIPTDEVPR